MSLLEIELEYEPCPTYVVRDGGVEVLMEHRKDTQIFKLLDTCSALRIFADTGAGSLPEEARRISRRLQKCLAHREVTEPLYGYEVDEVGLNVEQVRLHVLHELRLLVGILEEPGSDDSGPRRTLVVAFLPEQTIQALIVL